MNRIFALFAFAAILALPFSAFGQAHKVVHAKDGSGVFGYKDTPIQPWSGYHVHDPDRPAPKKVDPGAPGSDRPNQPPSDAIVLFDGKDLSAWQPTQWKVEEGCLVATEGPMATKQEFGSCQLHVEWQVPLEQPESVWNHGNNGVFLGGSIEVQIFDSYRTKIYPDGQAAAIYAQTPPLVNACRKPGEWEVYDIVYRAPKFGKDGKVESPARITMFHNGVLVHWDQEIYGGSPHAGVASYESVKARAPIAFGAHGCPVRFRNIWIRPLDAEPKPKTP
ncbi:MAG: DUF1080 domain-containing protein [Thermoguttaceae bacterium]|jgi:hypothetical protein|nr:DUF1080 domain-containing protein [Thermoguttaceae bacterium]